MYFCAPTCASPGCLPIACSPPGNDFYFPPCRPPDQVSYIIYPEQFDLSDLYPATFLLRTSFLAMSLVFIRFPLHFSHARFTPPPFVPSDAHPLCFFPPRWLAETACFCLACPDPPPWCPAKSVPFFGVFGHFFLNCSCVLSVPFVFFHKCPFL